MDRETREAVLRDLIVAAMQTLVREHGATAIEANNFVIMTATEWFGVEWTREQQAERIDRTKWRHFNVDGYEFEIKMNPDGTLSIMREPLL